MSLSYSDKSVIGGPFDTGVITQLNRRKNVIGKVNTRGPEDIQYLTANTGWVRVMSSVNTAEEGNKPAKDSVLIGGTLNSFDGFNFDNNKASYNKSNTYGFTPKTGITSFQVQSKGTFGTLRTASFNFTVSSPEDFSRLEQLYLRPGFSILLEWGHTYYLSNKSGNLTPMMNLFDVNSFMSKKTDTEIEKSIEGLKNGSNSYNYDAMFGIIKNFIWNYNGYTYECQVDVVSKGEIVESVQSSMSPLVQVEEDKEGADGKYTPYGSELEAFLTSLVASPGLEPGGSESDRIIKELLKLHPSLTDSIIKQHGQVGKKFEITTNINTNVSVGLAGSTKYITLRTLLILLNEINMLCTPDNKPTPRFHIGEDGIKNTFITFQQHTPLNIGINFLPKSGETISNEYFTIQNPSASEQIDDILEICISANFILDTLTEKRTKQEIDTKVVDFLLVDVLGQVQNNLGEINYFDIHEDIKNGITYLHIVDRNVVPDKTKLKTKLDLVGLNSEVSNLSIVSKLSSNLTSMIAISAQDVYSPSSAQDLYNIQKWNKGLKDRHLDGLKVGTNTETTKVDPTEVPNRALRNKLYEYIEKVNNLISGVPGVVLPDPTGLESMHKQVMKEYVRVNTTKGKNGKPTNPPGLIPFELSFTIKGISGIKVGQAFTINDFFLPQRYKGNVGFIVTGIDHTVADNRWTTEIKSQMIFL